MTVPHPFDRYADFVDIEKLKEASVRPLRKCKRVNTLKCTVEEFLAWGKSKEWKLDPVPWCQEGFFVDRPSPSGLRPASHLVSDEEPRREALGKDLLHVLGYTYIQEASSMLPVELLDPKPGETVLDMSAAPGSKATQIAAKISGAERGFLIANDVQENRIWGMLTNLQRCGVVDCLVTKKVGQWFAGNMTEAFDRVLCDAPCTAQGTSRKDSDALKYASEDSVGKMAKLQRELLESAIHACKIGGRIVYSTCTLTPEENELLVLQMVNKFSEQLSIVDPKEAVSGKRVAGSVFEKAIDDSHKVQEWLRKGNSSLPATRYPLVRLWPQTFDTEGFFSAVLEKRAPTRDKGKRTLPPHRFDLIPKARMKEVGDRLLQWYGSSFLREDELLVEIKEQLFVIPQSALHLKIPVRPYLSGLPFAKTTVHGMPRLSHEIATLRGSEAKSQVLVLSEGEMREAIAGKNLRTKDLSVKDGDVLLALDKNPLGRRIVFGRGLLKAGQVLNRLPRDVVRLFA